MNIKILGAKWKLIYEYETNDKVLEGADGYCDSSIKTIVIRRMEPNDYSLKDLIEYTKKVKRHEIVHAFLYESGLANNSNDIETWARNEEMVDWIAIQGIKIYKAWKKAKAI